MTNPRSLALMAIGLFLSSCGGDGPPTSPPPPPPPLDDGGMVWDEDNWDEANWQDDT